MNDINYCNNIQVHATYSCIDNILCYNKILICAELSFCLRRNYFMYIFCILIIYLYMRKSRNLVEIYGF